jgi:3-phosphoshikimate 1-carboxyvinyltransferase
MWAAPCVNGPINAVLTSLPGSKSLTNRALVLAALSDGPSVVEKALRSRDTELMLTALQTLGVEVHVREKSTTSMTVEITPHVVQLPDPVAIDVGLAGTVMRFLPPLAGLVHGEILFDGDPAARRRPMATLIEAMRDVGINVDDGGNGKLPIAIHGRGHIPGGEVVLDASRSSQFVSALLLSAPRFEAGATIHHVGNSIPSTPHIDMTIQMLVEHNVVVRSTPDPPIDDFQRCTWHVDPQDVRARDWVIEPDVSNALPFIAAAVVTGGQLRIENWPRTSLQPSSRVLEVLSGFGAHISFEDSALVVDGPVRVSPVDMDLSDIGETAPTMVAIATFADGPSTLRGIGHLRGHETDRLAALEREISGLGGLIEATADALRIQPADLHEGSFHTYDDHRMATTAAIIGLKVPGVLVENIATTAKTLPDFPALWSEITER